MMTTPLHGKVDHNGLYYFTWHGIVHVVSSMSIYIQCTLLYTVFGQDTHSPLN